MAFVVREPAIIAGRLRFGRDIVTDPDEIKEIKGNAMLLRSCVEIPDVEVAPVSLKPLPKVED